LWPLLAILLHDNAAHFEAEHIQQLAGRCAVTKAGAVVLCGFHKVRDTDFSKSRTAISVSAGQ